MGADETLEGVPVPLLNGPDEGVLVRPRAAELRAQRSRRLIRLQGLAHPFIQSDLSGPSSVAVNRLDGPSWKT